MVVAKKVAQRSGHKYLLRRIAKIDQGGGMLTKEGREVEGDLFGD